jgi:hypothetical protein
MRWLRAMALHENPVLFTEVEPADALQGSLGNCWLIAAMAAIAEFPSYMKNNIFQNKKARLFEKSFMTFFIGSFGSKLYIKSYVIYVRLSRAENLPMR